MNRKGRPLYITRSSDRLCRVANSASNSENLRHGQLSDSLKKTDNEVELDIEEKILRYRECLYFQKNIKNHLVIMCYDASFQPLSCVTVFSKLNENCFEIGTAVV